MMILVRYLSCCLAAWFFLVSCTSREGSEAFFLDEPFIPMAVGPVLVSGLPDNLRFPLTESIVFRFLSSSETDSYEFYLAGREFYPLYERVEGVEINRDLEPGTRLSYVLYPPGHPLYDSRNSFVMGLLSSDRPYYWFVRAISLYESRDSDKTLPLTICSLPPPDVFGFKGRCSQTPCYNSAMYSINPIEWRPVEGAFSYELEIFEYNSIAPPKGHWRKSFDRFSQEQKRNGENPEYPMVLYARVNKTSYQMPVQPLCDVDLTEAPVFDKIVPGYYLFRVRAITQGCKGEWSSYFPFSYAVEWQGPAKPGGAMSMAFPVGGTVEGISVNNLGSMALIAGSGNLQLYQGGLEGLPVIASALPVSLDINDLALDPHGNGVDDSAIDDFGNIFVASDQAGYIYRYGCEEPVFDPLTRNVMFCRNHVMDRRIGSGVSIPPDPAEDTLFWGVDVAEGQVFTTDANNYKVDTGDDRDPPRYPAKPPRLICSWDATTGVRIRCFKTPRIGVPGPSGNEVFGIAADRCMRRVIVGFNDAGIPHVYAYSFSGELLGVVDDSADLERPLSPTGCAVGCDGLVYVMDGFGPSGRPGRSIHVYQQTDEGSYQPMTWCGRRQSIGNPVLGPRILRNTAISIFGRGLAVDRRHNVFLARINVVHAYGPYPYYK